MDAVAKIQKELGSSIEKGYSNFKKDSQERKTVESCKKKLTILEENWNYFQKNHKTLEEFAGTHSEHPYFANSYFEQVEGAVQKYKRALEDLLNRGSGNEMPNDKPSEVIQLLRRQKALIKSTTHMIAEINEKLETTQPPQFYRFKAELLKRQKELLDENWHAVWACYENYDQSEDEEAYNKVDTEVQMVIIKLYQHVESTPKTLQFNHQLVETAKLPAISLPTFLGDYTDWIQFKDLFEQLIHNSPISAAQKMFYLVGKLSGEARTLIQHLPVCDRNYEVAWSLLKQRYHNDRVLVNAFISKFLSQQPTQADSATSIKRLHDTTNECLMGLRNLGVNTEHWDAIVSHIILKKLDRTTHMLYEQTLENPRSLENVSKVLSFLEARFQTIEAMKGKQSSETKTTTKPRTSVLVANPEKMHCAACPESHPLFACKEFVRQSVPRRQEIVQRANLCRNCLKPGHRAAKCTRGVCTRCQQKHNTLLHNDDEQRKAKDNSKTSLKQPSSGDSKIALVSQSSLEDPAHVILGTIMVTLRAANGRAVECRALLDTGSQLNFITEKVAKRLAITGVPDPISIQGIGPNRSIAQTRVQVQMQSRITKCKLDLDAFVLPKITTVQPASQLDISTWKMPAGIQLADPEFHKPAPIEVLIGVEHCFDLQLDGRINLGKDLPMLQNTTFGWIVAGKLSKPSRGGVTPSCLIGTREALELNKQIERFWEVETVETSAPPRTSAERKCEAHFRENTKQNPDGRFVVRLPFSEDPSVLGDSKEQAQSRFLAIERRFNRNPDLKAQYVSFMQEYIKLEHMSEITDLPALHYFLPHHCVYKPDSETTKLRVVFDGSAKTSSRLSLNDILFTGPKIQEDIFSVLLRFRLPRYVCSADIEKMYRQILVANDDRQYQMIVWRKNPQEALRYYQLNTVTYGLTTAPYLAIRCLHRLAQDNQVNKPLGSAAILQNMYVDDAMFGADTLSEALETQKQLRAILNQGGFKLRKWCANHEAFTKDLPSGEVAARLDLVDESNPQVKALGLRWLPKEDELRVTVNYVDTVNISKRQVLSDIAHLFDPLGLMGPVTVTAKLMLQRLWRLNLDWDDIIPDELLADWRNFRQNLNALCDIAIPRHISSHSRAKDRQLHVFCDASERAYGAAIYIRSSLIDGTIRVRLLCAKSRIAPLKPITLPRLELCAAKLGTDLSQRVKTDLNWNDPIKFWTDSEIVLSWLRSQASSLQKFVANRVAAIQELTLESQWKHVPSKKNPADLISRGVAPEVFSTHQQWFYGPHFLHRQEHYWPNKTIDTETPLERRRPDTALIAATANDGFVTSLAHISSIHRIKRIVAYSLRFINNSKPTTCGRFGVLSVLELEQAMNIIIKEVQAEAFPQDLEQLRRHKGINSTSSISGLCPFLDEHGIMRVGGRLQNSDLSFEAKHPVILPQKHHVTRLIMRQIHCANNHIRQAGLLALTRQNYWPIHGKTVARTIIDKCVLCAREKPKLQQQIMGNLPKDRVQPSRPFIKSGVDFCGPFYVRTEIRGRPPQKAYVALFCCFATKAVHLEVVKNLTTDAFIQALKRFLGRRGNCNIIYCDNATNFVGANNQLSELKEVIHGSGATQQIQEFCSGKRINFKFIPPRAPHFGGLWEAAVKSAKQLFFKTASSRPLTYEELTTLVVEIEAILNSRPLTPLSDDPNDLTALTPGHLLIGDPLNSTIDPYAQINTLSLSDRWKELTRIKQEFWNRWSREYLSELQQRHKWKTSIDNIKTGTMVIVKEDNIPPLSWPLGRIANTIRGTDGFVRVVEIKTASGLIKRPIHKVAPLPIETEREETTATDTQSAEPIPGPSGYQRPSPDVRVQQNEPEPSTSKRTNDPGPSTSSKRKKVSWALTTLLAICFILPARVTEASINITPFKDHPGLLFERLGSASLIADEWTMVVFYSMKPFWAEYNSICAAAAKLGTFCTRLQDPESCEETLSYLRATLTELTTNNYLLSTKERRARRSPFDIIGNMANSLFGVLDSSYAERMSNIINQLEDNDQSLMNLIKNQTTIINATVNIIQSSHEDTTRRLQEFYEVLNTTTNTVNVISKAIDSQRLHEIFNSLSIRLTLAVSNFQHIQNALLNVLVDTHHGKVSPLLLSPFQLQKQIQLMREKLPTHLCPPMNPDNLVELYGIMNIQGRLFKDEIIFRVRMPLVTNAKFELFKNTPVPRFETNNTFTVIQPDSQYMLINLHHDQYYPTSDFELKTKCYKAQNSNFFCNSKQSPININVYSNGCDINIFLHTANSPKCRVKTTLGDPQFTRLQIENHWMYAIRHDIVISVICNNQITQHHLNGTGTFTLFPGCILKYGQLTIEGVNRHITLNSTSVFPTRNISEIIPIHDEGYQIRLAPNDRFNISEDIRRLNQRLDIVHRNSLVPKLTHHDVHQFSVSYTCLFVILAAIIVIVVKYCGLRIKGSVQPPVLVPRRRSQSQQASEFMIQVQD